jgi:hypothetical protein
MHQRNSHRLTAPEELAFSLHTRVRREYFAGRDKRG